MFLSIACIVFSSSVFATPEDESEQEQPAAEGEEEQEDQDQIESELGQEPATEGQHRLGDSAPSAPGPEPELPNQVSNVSSSGYPYPHILPPTALIGVGEEGEAQSTQQEQPPAPPDCEKTTAGCPEPKPQPPKEEATTIAAPPEEGAGGETTAAAPLPPAPKEVCGDGVDNDGDGLVDKDDTQECPTTTTATAPPVTTTTIPAPSAQAGSAPPSAPLPARYVIYFEYLTVHDDHDPFGSGEWYVWLGGNSHVINLGSIWGLNDVNDGETVIFLRPGHVQVVLSEEEIQANGGKLIVKAGGYEADNPPLDSNDVMGNLKEVYIAQDKFGVGRHFEMSGGKDYSLSYEIVKTR